MVFITQNIQNCGILGNDIVLQSCVRQQMCLQTALLYDTAASSISLFSIHENCTRTMYDCCCCDVTSSQELECASSDAQTREVRHLSRLLVPDLPPRQAQNTHETLPSRYVTLTVHMKFRHSSKPHWPLLYVVNRAR